MNVKKLLKTMILHYQQLKRKIPACGKLLNDVKEKKSNVIISAGNTGALFVISKLNMNMIENINKPALAALMAK